MTRRYELARGLMREQDLDFLVLFGNSGVNRHNHANHFWLSQWQDMHHCYLVVPRDGEATLLVGLVNHVPNARELSDVPNVEWGGYEPRKTIAGLVRGAGSAGGKAAGPRQNHRASGAARRVGLVGV